MRVLSHVSEVLLLTLYRLRAAAQLTRSSSAGSVRVISLTAAKMRRPLKVTMIEQLISVLRRDDTCVIAMPLDEEIGRAPDIKIIDHRAPGGLT